MGVPEGHDAIAHIFVDRAAMVHDDIRERRQQPVDKRRQLLGIVLHGFGNGGEAAYVGKQDGQGSPLAAELQLRGIVLQAAHEIGRDILREGAGYLTLLVALLRVIEGRLAEGDGDESDRRPERRDEDMGEADAGMTDRRKGKDGRERLVFLIVDI